MKKMRIRDPLKILRNFGIILYDLDFKTTGLRVNHESMYRLSTKSYLKLLIDNGISE